MHKQMQSKNPSYNPCPASLVKNRAQNIKLSIHPSLREICERGVCVVFEEGKEENKTALVTNNPPNVVR